MEEESPQRLDGVALAQFFAEPIAQRPAENAQNRGDQQGGDGRQEQQQAPQLPLEKPGTLAVSVDRLDAFHQQAHHLRARQKRATPANEGPLPGLRAALDEELRDDLLAAWRQQAREVG